MPYSIEISTVEAIIRGQSCDAMRISLITRRLVVVIRIEIPTDPTDPVRYHCLMFTAPLSLFNRDGVILGLLALSETAHAPWDYQNVVTRIRAYSD